MGSLNSDGSVKLGTVRTELLLKLGAEQGKDAEELKAIKELVDGASEMMESAKRKVDALQIITPLVPEDSNSPKHAFKVEQVVCYFKRENPTRTMSAAQAKKKAEDERRKSLMNAMREISDKQRALNEFHREGTIITTDFVEQNDALAKELQALADSLLGTK